MSSDFVKFPHTPHLAWLSPKPLREDRLLSDSEVAMFLRGGVVIEEKVDGANIGISVSSKHTLSVQNRGAFLEHPAQVQFQPLWNWLGSRSEQLIEGLGENLILFGEWCYAVHSIRYDRLPDWFIAFDIYDRSAGAYFATDRRNEVISKLNLFTVPQIARGHFSLSQVKTLLDDSSSAFGSSKIEGLYLRREARDWLEQRVKIVRSEFTQSITSHWASRPLTKNVLVR
jgi:ATP-dependent RNA circularization protein (DNA/RNA ligase family)